LPYRRGNRQQHGSLSPSRRQGKNALNYRVLTSSSWFGRITGLRNGGVLASLDKLMTIEVVVQKLSAKKGLLQRKSQAVFTVMVSARERLEGLTRELFRFDY
jgi:hypothetical protein